ncbi:MAG: Fic family protein [Bacilli bacterium]|nr:Fic family protein [Bacilli bacterium]
MSIPLSELNFENTIDYHYDNFPPENLDYKQLVNQLVLATDAIARFDQMLKKMHNGEILLAPLRNQEAVISSRMEGTVSTMDEILKYEADYSEGDDTSTSTRSEIIETVLYQRALRASQKAIEEGYSLSEYIIKSAHERLLSFGRGAAKTPGKYKTEQNYLVDRTKRNVLFTPISPIKLQEGLEKLFKYIQNASDPILIKTAISHIEFEALHPFKDGNGRIGRMLITLMLWDEGVISAPHFYISSYFEENKDEYIDMMRNVSANNDWTEWVIFFLKAIEKQAIRNLTIAENINNLYEHMKNQFSEILASKYSVQALDYIFTNPVFRNNKFTQNSGIPFQTAARFTRVLVEKDLLKVLEEPSGRRAALYVFEPLMELVRV